MSFSNLIALFGTMLVLASIPSLSVLTVVSRSISAGFFQGAMTAIGIVTGDVLFILLAIYGMSAIATTMGSFFIILKYLGAAYLIWLGVSLWRSKLRQIKLNHISTTSWQSSYISGLLITLGDQKAVIFYMGFLPAFINLSQISIIDTGLIIIVAITTVGGVKLMYAYLADRTRSLFQNKQLLQSINYLAGAIMIGTGIWLVVRAHI